MGNTTAQTFTGKGQVNFCALELILRGIYSVFRSFPNCRNPFFSSLTKNPNLGQLNRQIDFKIIKVKRRKKICPFCYISYLLKIKRLFSSTATLEGGAPLTKKSLYEICRSGCAFLFNSNSKTPTILDEGSMIMIMILFL